MIFITAPSTEPIMAGLAKPSVRSWLDGVKESMIDRLSLNHDRLSQMADGLRQIAKLNDPIGEVMSMSKRPNGLIIGK